MADLNIPVQGMNNAQSMFNTAASRIARMPLSAQSPSSSSGPQDTVDLSEEMVSIMKSKNDFAANVKVAQTFDEMNKNVLSILA